MRASRVLSVQQRETAPDDVENLVEHGFAGHLVGCGAALMDGQNRVLHAGLSGSCGRDSPTALAMTPGVGDRQLRDGERRFGSGRISIVVLDGGRRRAAVVTERFGQRLQ
jgi:hypothetical protein